MSRLSEDRRSELYDGTLRLVVEHGFEKLTMDQIAEATRSSKATLYRQWGSKSALVIEALQSFTPDDEMLPDTGTVRGDLHEMLAFRRRGFDDDAEFMAAIMHAVKADPELGSAVRLHVLAKVREHIDTMLEQGVARGEIDKDCPALPHMSTVLLAPFVLHPLIHDEPLDDDIVHDYIESVLLPALGISGLSTNT